MKTNAIISALCVVGIIGALCSNGEEQHSVVEARARPEATPLPVQKVVYWSDIPGMKWDWGTQVTNAPSIPAAANDGTLTIQKNGKTLGTFGANQSSNTTVNVKSVYYATCDTAQYTSAKVATLNDSNETFVLEEGVVVYVKFTNGPYNGSMSLRIGDTTAKSMKFISRSGSWGNGSGVWYGGDTVGFIYDGNNWILLSNGYASTTSCGIVKFASSFANLGSVAAQMSSLYSVGTSIAPCWVKDANTSYSAGDLVMYTDGKLYKAKVDIAANTAWNASNWQAITVKDEFAPKSWVDGHQWTWNSITNKPDVVTYEQNGSLYLPLLYLGLDWENNDAGVVIGHGTDGSISDSVGFINGANNTISGGTYATVFGLGGLATNAFAFVYSSDYSGPGSEYGDHGFGTFNVNPNGGLSGFWIGETNLATYLANAGSGEHTHSNLVNGTTQVIANTNGTASIVASGGKGLTVPANFAFSNKQVVECGTTVGFTGPYEAANGILFWYPTSIQDPQSFDPTTATDRHVLLGSMNGPTPTYVLMCDSGTVQPMYSISGWNGSSTQLSREFPDNLYSGENITIGFPMVEAQIATLDDIPALPSDMVLKWKLDDELSKKVDKGYKHNLIIDNDGVVRVVACRYRGMDSGSGLFAGTDCYMETDGDYYTGSHTEYRFRIRDNVGNLLYYAVAARSGGAPGTWHVIYSNLNAERAALLPPNGTILIYETQTQEGVKGFGVAVQNNEMQMTPWSAFQDSTNMVSTTLVSAEYIKSKVQNINTNLQSAEDTRVALTNLITILKNL